MNQPEDSQQGTTPLVDGAAGSGVAQDDPRVLQALHEYLAALEAGRRPDRQEFLARLPAIREALADCLDGLDFVYAAAPQLHDPSAGNTAAPDASGTPCQPALPLGDFRIRGEIGRGGMGIVYEAEQLSLGRRVALKVLPFAATLDPRQRERFKHEAQAAAHLHHSNIVPVFAVGYERGVHYYAMQFIEGQSLAAVIQDARECSRPGASVPRASASWPDEPSPQTAMPPSVAEVPTLPRAALTTQRSAKGSAFFRTVAELGVQAAEALEYAHQQGVVHRDIKPANLLVDERNHVWITDFGLAHFQGDTRLSMTGDLVGTLRYMSPEQALGQRGLLDHRTDIYSLGMTLYELLTLEPAFRSRDRQELVQQIGFDEPQPPRHQNKAIPRELETIVLKCLVKEADGRYATAQELADDLKRFLEDRPIQARRCGLAGRAARWSRRHKPVVVAALVLLLLALLGLAVSTALIWREHQDTKAALAEAQTSYEAAARQGTRAEERELTARRYLYNAHLHLAQQAWQNSHLARALELLEGQAPGPAQEDLRSFEWYYVWRLCHSGHQATLRGHGAAVRTVAFSPDGTALASAGADGSLRLWDPATGQERQRLGGYLTRVACLAFAPDGKTVALGTADGTVLWDLATGREQAIRPGRPRGVTALAFSPDGRTLGIGNNLDNVATLWDVAAARERTLLSGHTGGVYSMAFAPDSLTVATGSLDTNVKLWDSATGQERATLRGHGGATLGVAFSPDGRTLASASDDWEVKLWDVATRRMQLTLDGHKGGVYAVAFAPDGKTVASGGADGTVRTWDVGTGQQRAALMGHRGIVLSLAFAPDGKTLASAGSDGTVKLWHPAQQDEPATLPVHRGTVWSVAFAPDGRTAASGSVDGMVKLWDTTTRKERLSLKTHSGGIYCLAFAPDGNMLASASMDTTVKLWDPASGNERSTLQGHTDVVRCLAFAPDGNSLATGGDDQTVKLWDVASGREGATLRGHKGGISCMAFAPDGKMLASGSSDQTLKLWDAVTGRERTSFEAHVGGVRSVAFAPDGKTLATAGDWAVKLWDLDTGRLQSTLRGHAGSIYTLAFAPDGKTLATGSMDTTVKLWDPATAQERLTLAGASGRIHSLAFAPDGRLLAAGRHDGTVTLWRAAREP